MDTEVREHVTDSGQKGAGILPAKAWAGHLPITQRRLLSILERTQHCTSEFTVPERALFMLCEFWAAVNAQDLCSHWQAGAEENVITLITICSAIDLPEVAQALTEMDRDMGSATTQAQRRDRVRALEAQLTGLTIPVDEAICRFAQATALSR